MAHELSIRKDGKVEAMFAGTKPWHGLGTMVQELQQPQEALKLAPNDSDLWFQRGWLREVTGQQEGACEAYEKALELDAQNAQAAFRLAYYMDLRSEDARAVELYKRVAG